MRRILILCLAFCIGRLLCAQLVFIPDSLVRVELNGEVNGCVDANGFLDLTYPGVDGIGSIYLLTDHDHLDLTGLETLPGLHLLHLHAEEPSCHLTCALWPPQLEKLDMQGISNASIPAFPATLLHLSIITADSLTAVPALPLGLQRLSLAYMPELTALPALPPQLNFMALEDCDLISVPDVPTTLDSLWITDMHVLSSLPPFPQELIFLRIDSAASLTTLPDMPPGMLYVHLSRLPITTTPQFGDDMQALELWILWDLATIPSLPAHVTDLTITQCPPLDTVPAIGEGCVSFSLSMCPRINHIPDLPSTLDALWLSHLDSLQNITAYPPALKDLTFQLCSLITDVGPLPNTLERLELNYQPGIHALPILPDSLTTLILQHDVPIDCLPVLPDALETLSDSDSYLECLPNMPSSLVNLWPPGLAGMLCSEDPGSCASTYPRATGTVYHDVNTNGARDAGEAGMRYVTITASPCGFATGSDSLGQYELAVPLDEHTLTCHGVDPWVISVAPSEHVVLLAEAGVVDSLNDFGMVLVPDVRDLRVSAVSTPARPGFTNDVWLSALNAGSVVQDASLRMITDTAQTFVSAEPAPTAASGDTLWWDLPQLAVFEQRQVAVVLGTPPTASIGTPLAHDIVAEPLATDTTPSDNALVLADSVVASFDPNDKRVEPAIITPDEAAAGERLYYTIRFQNTGNFPAERVLLTDDLPIETDRLSFHFEGSSHPCTWTIENGQLEVLYEPIQLPSDDQDEPGSHGYFRFSIRVMDTLLPGAQFPNIAYIYFDFNEAVITEPAWLAVDSPTAMEDQPANALVVWPNPTQGELHVLGVTSPATLGLSSIDGRPVISQDLSGGPILLDMRAMPSGTYLLRIDQPGARSVRRVVKL